MSNQLRELHQLEKLLRDPAFLKAVERKEWRVERASPGDESLRAAYAWNDARMSVRCLTHGKVPKFDLRQNAKQLPLNMLNSEDPWPEIEKLVAKGWSLVVNSEQNSKCSLRLLADALQRFTGRRTQLNTYYTPVSSRCFKTHVDDHDVFVFQVSGEKFWEIYPLAERTVSEKGVHWKLPSDQDQPVFAKTIRAGDIIYLPEGYPHRANCEEQPSLHLTFGIRRKSSSWKGLLMESAEAFFQGDSLDTEYVPQVTRTDEETALQDLDVALKALRDDMAGRIRKELREPAAPVFDPVATRPDNLEAIGDRLLSDPEMQLIVDSPPEIKTTDYPPRLHTPGSKIYLRRPVSEFVSRLPVARPFRVSDCAESMDEALALDICRFLLLNGIARPA